MKITTLCCGSMRVPNRAGANRNFILDAAAGLLSPAAGTVRLPNCAYLVEHPKGLVLIDTGWDRAFFPDGRFSPAAAKGFLPPALSRYYRPELPEGTSALEQLSKMGIQPEDLACIVLTQLTADHTCGLRPLAAAQRILVSQREAYWTYRSAFSVRQPTALWKGTGLSTYEMCPTQDGPRDHSYDLFEDGSILLVETPGATFGQVSVLLTSENGSYALISSDLAATSDSVKKGVMDAPVYSKGAGVRSLKWLTEMAAAPECRACLVNHDPAAWSQAPVIL